jgi:hypothetical protein
VEHVKCIQSLSVDIVIFPTSKGQHKGLPYETEIDLEGCSSHPKRLQDSDLWRWFDS